MNLRQDEKIILIIHRHWIYLVSAFTTPVVIFLILIITKVYFKFNFLGYTWQVFVGFLLFALIYIIYKIYIWRHNQLIITSQRLVNNQQRGIFDRTVTELLYQDLVDTSYVQTGVASSIYNYGDLILRILSENQIKIEQIPEPENVIELINRIRVSFKSSTSAHL